MKTVLITAFQAVVAKNLLRTDVVKALLAPTDTRVVCLTRFPERSEYYQKEISHSQLVYDSFYQSPRSIFEKLFSFLKFHTIKTATTGLRRRAHLEESNNYFVYFASLIFNRLIARKAVRQILRFLDYRLVGDPGYSGLLERHKPDAIVLTHLFDDAEIAILREAKKRGIKTTGYINSWDKITARCALRLLPDTLIVFNEIVKQEAIEHADMPADRIKVCGIPQYDQYVNSKPRPRKSFAAKLKLDLRKKLILFAPMGSAFSDSDWDAIDLLNELIVKGQLLNVELLVRFQPNDFIDEGELAKRPWLKYDLPGVRYGSARGGDWDMTFEDLQHLTDTLHHSAAVVSYASSIGIDAAVVGRPVININFELGPARHLAKSPTFYYHTEHYRKALRTDGIRLVNNQQELVAWLKSYLENPALDKEKRVRLVEEQCWRADGKAGRRVARAILEAVEI